MLSLSVIVPALNEEEALETTVEGLRSDLGNAKADYEIIIVDDASSDATGPIANKLAAGDRRIKVLHNAATRGVGHAFAAGIEHAAKDYVVVIPGDGENSLSGLLEQIGLADIIVPYVLNPEVRPRLRRVVSRIFAILAGAASGIRLRYSNGTVVYRLDRLRKRDFSIPRGPGFQAETLVRLIRDGSSVREVGIYLRCTSRNTTRVFRPASILGTLASLARLWRLRF